MTMLPLQERMDWIERETRLLPAMAVDVLNADFVDRYAAKTGAKLVIKMYGANGCPQLGRDLGEMSKRGILTRRRVGISGLPVGFPKWVWNYSIPPHHQ